eukprot:1103355_1
MTAPTTFRWVVSWGKRKYDLYWDDTTTIQDVKAQLELFTSVAQSRIKLIGLKVKREHKEKSTRIQDDTPVHHLRCVSKKGSCFQMIGSANKIFNLNDLELKYNTQFGYLIQHLFTMSGIKCTQHTSRSLPRVVTKLIIFYFITQPFNLKANNPQHISSISADGSIVTALNITKLKINLGSVINIQNMSHYECRLKMLNMPNTAHIIFGVRDMTHNYGRGDGLSWVRGRWRAKKHHITLNELKNTQSVYFRNVDDKWKQKDIVRVSVNCMDRTIATINETTGYKFTFEEVTGNCVFKMSIRGGVSVQILEQYCLERSELNKHV